MNSEKYALVFVCVFLILLSSCEKKLPVREISIEREGQTVAVVKAEVARSHEERNLGLMYREKLPDGEGMLFIFEKDDILSFWMENTLIPLSIAFIGSDGLIHEIKDMYPKDRNSTLSSRAARYALEVPQGWFARAGVKTGDVVRMGN